MERQENLFQFNGLQKNQNHSQIPKLQEETLNEHQIETLVTMLIQQNERLLTQINNAAKSRKNKNHITPQMSLFTNKLQRNLLRIARLLPPQALADPQHVKQQKQRFLKFYRGRNVPKKQQLSINQNPNGIVSNNTPTKLLNQGKQVKKQ